MKTSRVVVYLVILLLAALLISGFSFQSGAQSYAAASATPTKPKASATPIKPKASATPVRLEPRHIVQTAFVASMQSGSGGDNTAVEWAQALVKDGTLKSAAGKVTKIKDFSAEWAQRNYFQWWNVNLSPTNFVFRADIDWESDPSDKTPELNLTGCGVVFHLVDNSNFYFAYPASDGNVYIRMFRSGSSSEVARAKYDTHGLAHTLNFMMAVEGNNATLYVDGNKLLRKAITQFQKGSLALTLLSGTNRGFGTRCAMTNMEVLELSGATTTTVSTPVSSSANLPLPYSEDFEDKKAQNWKTDSADKWLISTDQEGSFLRGTGAEKLSQIWLDNGKSIWMDYAMESRIRIRKGAIYFGGRAMGQTFYTAFISETGAVELADFNGKEQDTTKRYTALGSGTFSFEADTWYSVRFELLGEELKVFINDEMIAAGSSSSWVYGSVGYFISANSDIDIDDIKVIPLP